MRNCRSETHGLFRIAAAVVVAIASAVWSVAVAGQAVNTSTNQIGRLTSMGNSQTQTYQEYDDLGRVAATQYVQDGRSRVFKTRYGYPQNSAAAAGPGTAIVMETFPDGEEVFYSYDAGGQRVTVRSRFGSMTDDVVREMRMNARGQLTRSVLGNGTIIENAYNDGGDLRLARRTTVNAAGQKIQDYGYTYDGNGNVTGTSDGVRPNDSATYQYDELGQLKAMINAFGTAIETYSYDSIGNLTQKGMITQTYGAGGRPHALATSGGTSYVHDGNGNVTSIGGTTTLEWNAENMPTRVVVGSVVSEKSYVDQALWKKVEQGTTTYYLPSMRVEDGVARKYYGGVAERVEQAGDRQLRFYHADHLGSSSVMTDQSGNVIRRASYMPWGNERGVQGVFIPKLQFNFKEKDATGFYDYGARLYHPVTGRWLSPDPLLADGSNRYAYVRNNPWSLMDPDGRQSKQEKQQQQPPPPPPLPPQQLELHSVELRHVTGIINWLFSFIQAPEQRWVPVPGTEVPAAPEIIAAAQPAYDEAAALYSDALKRYEQIKMHPISETSGGTDLSIKSLDPSFSSSYTALTPDALCAEVSYKLKMQVDLLEMSLISLESPLAGHSTPRNLATTRTYEGIPYSASFARTTVFDAARQRAERRFNDLNPHSQTPFMFRNECKIGMTIR
jgi:RHS repeat-associated protein